MTDEDFEKIIEEQELRIEELEKLLKDLFVILDKIDQEEVLL